MSQAACRDGYTTTHCLPVEDSQYRAPSFEDVDMSNKNIDMTCEGVDTATSCDGLDVFSMQG